MHTSLTNDDGNAEGEEEDSIDGGKSGVEYGRRDTESVTRHLEERPTARQHREHFAHMDLGGQQRECKIRTVSFAFIQVVKLS